MNTHVVYLYIFVMTPYDYSNYGTSRTCTHVYTALLAILSTWSMWYPTLINMIPTYMMDAHHMVESRNWLKVHPKSISAGNNGQGEEDEEGGKERKRK